MKKTIAETFDDHWILDPVRGCHIWQRAGAKSKPFYGKLSVNGKLKLAHRYAWERKNGLMPAHLQACHSCDNPPCVNEAHIFPGTDQENKQDALRKGRGRRGVHKGEANAKAKLTAHDVKVIRRRVARGETQTAVAADYNLHKTNVQCICSKKTWRHVA